MTAARKLLLTIALALASCAGFTIPTYGRVPTGVSTVGPVVAVISSDFTYGQVGDAIRRLGHYRTVRAQALATEGPADHVGGTMMLAVGLRETGLRNIEGGAYFDGSRWQPQPDPRRMDVGWSQISRIFHADALAAMPGVRCGTWSPVVAGKTADDGGYCGRFSDEARFTRDEMIGAEAYAKANGVPTSMLKRFIVASHNAGLGGALRGFRAGDVDRYTTGGDYSAWTLRHATIIGLWLRNHPTWRP